MSRKVLIISSSPRIGGNTDMLCDEFMRGARQAGNDVKKIHLAEKNISYCTGCGICNVEGKDCPHKDDAAEIIEDMINADVIVLATPVYFYAMSAQLKTLIDRCCGKYTKMNDKSFYFIAAGAENASEMQLLEKAFDNMMGFLECLENPVLKGKVMAAGVWQKGEIKNHPAMLQAYQLGLDVK